MKVFHTISMNYQRLTVSLPYNVYEELVSVVGRGKVSPFVAEATESKLLEEKLRKKDPVAAFFSHKKGLPKRTHNEILAAVKKGRT